jgi:hypothetical protein
MFRQSLCCAAGTVCLFFAHFKDSLTFIHFDSASLDIFGSKRLPQKHGGATHNWHLLHGIKRDESK